MSFVLRVMLRIIVLGALVAVGCGGKQSGGPEPGEDGGLIDLKGDKGDTWRAPAQEQTPEIPPFPDRCSRYEIEYSPHTPGDLKPGLTCSCAGGVYDICDLSTCVTSFNCDALCQSFGEPGPTLHECAGGDCDVGADYGPIQCVALPGSTKGTFLINEWCFGDTDCGTDERCVAITEDGVRSCVLQGTQCNDQQGCRDGNRCALPDDSFVGYCGDGRDLSPCFSDDDCRMNARCIWGALPLLSPEHGLCSTGTNRALCVVDTHCEVGRCLQSVCNAGKVSDWCETNADCETGLQCISPVMISAADPGSRTRTTALHLHRRCQFIRCSVATPHKMRGLQARNNRNCRCPISFRNPLRDAQARRRVWVS